MRRRRPHSGRERAGYASRRYRLRTAGAQPSAFPGDAPRGACLSRGQGGGGDRGHGGTGPAWEDSAATSRRSYAAAIRGNEFSDAYHVSDYAVYAYLQLARDAAARSAMEDAFKVKVTPPTAASAYASAAMPARYAVERGDWRGALLLRRHRTASQRPSR